MGSQPLIVFISNKLTYALSAGGFFVLLIIIFAIYWYLKPAPKKPLKKGDYVMFRPKYKNLYPMVPTSHALVIENIITDEAIVVFATTSNQILKQKVPLYTLALAS